MGHMETTYKYIANTISNVWLKSELIKIYSRKKTTYTVLKVRVKKLVMGKGQNEPI